MKGETSCGKEVNTYSMITNSQVILSISHIYLQSNFKIKLALLPSYRGDSIRNLTSARFCLHDRNDISIGFKLSLYGPKTHANFIIFHMGKTK